MFVVADPWGAKFESEEAFNEWRDQSVQELIDSVKLYVELTGHKFENWKLLERSMRRALERIKHVPITAAVRIMAGLKARPEKIIYDIEMIENP